MTPSINPNDRVRVKLTETGKTLIVQQIDQLNLSLSKRPHVKWRAKVPEWDDDGWISGQFHVLMHYFDGCWSLGQELPFTELKKIG